MKILIVEDNVDLNEALVKGLLAKGYTVDSSFDGEDAETKIRVNEYDLLVLDINIPKINGFELAELVRQENEAIPMLALTARSRLDDKLNGFGKGFDDYLTKPFEFPELIARIEALIRRAKPNHQLILSVKSISVDPVKRIVTVGNKQVELTKIEFNMLEYLLRQKSLVVTNAELIEHVWSEEPDLVDPPIRSHIKNLRRKIKDNRYDIIKTIPGVGYKID